MRLALLAAACVAAFPALAQDGARCASRIAIAENLAGQFGERQTAFGLSESGQSMIEVWASPETGTWTILVSLPDGQSCMVAAGVGFTAVPRGPDGVKM